MSTLSLGTSARREPETVLQASPHYDRSATPTRTDIPYRLSYCSLAGTPARSFIPSSTYFSDPSTPFDHLLPVSLVGTPSVVTLRNSTPPFQTPCGRPPPATLLLIHSHWLLPAYSTVVRPKIQLSHWPRAAPRLATCFLAEVQPLPTSPLPELAPHLRCCRTPLAVRQLVFEG